MVAPAFVARVLNSEKWAFPGLGPSVIICSHKTGFLLLFFTKAIGLQLRLNVLHNVSIHLFTYLSIHLSIQVSIHPSVSPSIPPLVHSSIHLFTRSLIHPSTHLFIHHPSIHSSIRPSIHLPTCPSIHSSIHPTDIHRAHLCAGYDLLLQENTTRNIKYRT